MIVKICEKKDVDDFAPQCLTIKTRFKQKVLGIYSILSSDWTSSANYNSNSCLTRQHVFAITRCDVICQLQEILGQQMTQNMLNFGNVHYYVSRLRSKRNYQAQQAHIVQSTVK